MSQKLIGSLTRPCKDDWLIVQLVPGSSKGQNSREPTYLNLKMPEKLYGTPLFSAESAKNIISRIDHTKELFESHGLTTTELPRLSEESAPPSDDSE